MTTISVGTTDELVEAVRAHPHVVPHGRGTKSSLIAEDSEAVRLDLSALTGVIEYEPGEFTFSAYAGTPVREVQALLEEHGQYMPFDPPFVSEGATIGGTLAAGLNGPGRLRYGGLRDFVIGVRFVDGTGTLVRGGGKVVKNSAGFDLPKLVVGSMGRLGAIAEVTFKVFPVPAGWRTIRVSCPDLETAVRCIAELGRAPLDLHALELVPPGTLMIRVGGDVAAIEAHARRVAEATEQPYALLTEDEEREHWEAERNFAWVGAARTLLKIPITLQRVSALERILEPRGLPRRYGVAGNVAWLSWPSESIPTSAELDGLRGLTIRGPIGRSPILESGEDPARPFSTLVKQALDPDNRFPALA